jgi:hypothetical protein
MTRIGFRFVVHLVFELHTCACELTLHLMRNYVRWQGLMTADQYKRKANDVMDEVARTDTEARLLLPVSSIVSCQTP